MDIRFYREWCHAALECEPEHINHSMLLGLSINSCLHHVYGSYFDRARYRH